MSDEAVTDLIDGPILIPTSSGDLVLRAETAGDRPFALALYSEQRGPELAVVPWSLRDKLNFLASQFALQEAHYRAHHPDADRWIVTRGDDLVGRLYVQRAPMRATPSRSR